MDRVRAAHEMVTAPGALRAAPPASERDVPDGEISECHTACPTSESDAAESETSERSLDCQNLDDDLSEEESSKGFALGAVLEAISSVVMRSEAALASDFLERLKPGEFALVLERGGEPLGSRLRVRTLGHGPEGWVSAVASNGTELWSQLPPQDKRLKQARLLFDPYARNYLMPEDFMSAGQSFNFRGLWLEALRDTWLLDRPSVVGDVVPLKAFTLAQVEDFTQGGRRIRVRLATDGVGWVTVVFRGRYPIWRLLPVNAGNGISIYPYTTERWEALRRIERDSFGDSERQPPDELGGLQCWIANSKDPSTNVFIDVATTGGPDMVVGYCAWMMAEDDSTHDADCLHVLSIAVDVEFRAQGIGEKLINWAQQRCRQRFPNAKFQSLHVRCGNTPAVRLYKKCGFAVMCVIANYYGDEDALYMARAFNGLVTMG